jgi:hypothetical protein
MYLAGDSHKFPLLYRVQWGSVLSFRHEQDNTTLVAKVFGNVACHVSFRPPRA